MQWNGGRSVGGDRAPGILVIRAHAEDFFSRSGGTIVRDARLGAEIRVVALSFGERSESGGLYAEEERPALGAVKEIRRQEATRRPAILGTEIRVFDLGDLCFDYSAQHVARVVDEIRSLRPDSMLSHHGPDPINLGHDAIWRLALRAAQLAGVHGLEPDHAPLQRPSSASAKQPFHSLT